MRNEKQNDGLHSKEYSSIFQIKVRTDNTVRYHPSFMNYASFINVN